MVNKAKMKKVMRQFTPKRTAIGSIGKTDLELPNFSKGKAPESDKDLANKKYIDDKKIESFTTTFTAGSIPFSDGTTLVQDNTNLFWDDTNNRLGLGTSSPIAPFDVCKDQASYTRIVVNNASAAAGSGTNVRFMQGATVVGGNWYDNASNTFTIGAQETGSQLTLQAGGAQTIRLTSGGLFGVNTTVPTHRYTQTDTINCKSGTNVDISELDMVFKNPADDNAEAKGIGFGLSSNTLNIGGAIVFERVGSQSYGSLHFATKTSGLGAGADIPIKMTLDNAGNLGIGNTTPTQPLSVKEKAGMSAIGGHLIKLTNKTGANSVAGETVMASTGTADAVAQVGANGTNAIGVFLEDGITDGSEAWVVVSGIADVKMDAGGAALGDRIITSATAGRGLVSNAPAVAVHFQEIGHCIETTAANALGRCVLHFL